MHSCTVLHVCLQARDILVNPITKMGKDQQETFLCTKSLYLDRGVLIGFVARLH